MAKTPVIEAEVEKAERKPCRAKAMHDWLIYQWVHDGYWEQVGGYATKAEAQGHLKHHSGDPTPCVIVHIHIPAMDY